MKDQAGILSMFEAVMSRVYGPAMAALQNWGELTHSPGGRKTVEQFMDNMSGFVHYMQSKYPIKQGNKL